LTAPSLIKLTQDGSYRERIEDSYTAIKTMKMSVRQQLLKDSCLENDEVRDIQENLANLVEEYRAIAFESESEEEDDGPYVEDDY
jgi:hypothetical protein